MFTIHIRSVTTKRQADGRLLYRIAGDDGQTYVTYDPLRAALCQRALERGWAVKVWSSPGWYYRDLDDLELVQRTEAAS